MEPSTEVSVIRKIIARYPSSSPQALLSDKVLMQSFAQTFPEHLDPDTKILSDLLSTPAKASFPLKKSSPISTSFFKSHRMLELETELKTRQKALKQLKNNFFYLQAVLSKQFLEENPELERNESQRLFDSITSDLLEIKFKILLVNQRLDLLELKVRQK